ITIGFVDIPLLVQSHLKCLRINLKLSHDCVYKVGARSVLNSGKSAIYLALDNSNNIVGYVCGEVSNLHRISHIMKMNIGVLKEFHGLGVGRVLADAIINHAEKIGILRMEATVITSNKLSFNLCKKFGFKVEGMREKSIKIDGNFHDEYLIARFSSPDFV
ncbi:MAG: GNAT family N-acetyltransferase, partial [Gammaproteobacteria bacterium]